MLPHPFGSFAIFWPGHLFFPTKRSFVSGFYRSVFFIFFGRPSGRLRRDSGAQRRPGKMSSNDPESDAHRQDGFVKGKINNDQEALHHFAPLWTPTPLHRPLKGSKLKQSQAHQADFFPLWIGR